MKSFLIDFSNPTWQQDWSKYITVTSDAIPFHASSEVMYNNYVALRSGELSAQETSRITFTFELLEDGEIEFPYYVSSEAGWDWLIIKIDNQQIIKISGTSYDWQIYSAPLSKGIHTLTVQYSLDIRNVSGKNLGAIGYLKLSGLNRQTDWETKNTNPLKDKQFLKELDLQNLQTYYAKIVVLDMKENPIQEITGQITAGSININAASAVRRACNLTFLANEDDNDLTNINHLLSINKKVKVEIGIENNIDNRYDNIIWFKQGIFVICQPNISHGTNGVIISLTCKDKMCLLNGECGGNFPAPVTFSPYNQMMEDGSITEVYPTMYEIIQTAVANYGGEAISKIIINDLPLEIKQIVRHGGSNVLYYNSKTHFYTTDEAYVNIDSGDWKIFQHNENIGYVYEKFTYPSSSELQTGIGENVCTLLDKIKNVLGNYEYFYDIDGNFVFQEIKNYLNNSYDETNVYRLDNNRKVEIAKNQLSILDNLSYQVDFNSNSKNIYNFEEGNGLIAAYSNSPNYMNIKNDFHIWGKNENKSNNVIHYHVVIKEKPTKMNKYNVVFLTDADGYTGRLRLATPEELKQKYYIENELLTAAADVDDEVEGNENSIDAKTETFITTDESTYVNPAYEMLNFTGADIVEYTPKDWRAELYLQGLSNQQKGIRPDIYQQELLDLFDAIYDFRKEEFKADIVNNPNDLNYFFDYLEPAAELFDISVDSLYPKIYSYQQDSIKYLYTNDIPDVILLDVGGDTAERIEILNRCELEGQTYSNVDSAIYASLARNVSGYSAQETMRELLYQYTHYNESITLQTRPIYYLDANSRITVNDLASGIHGDYIIKSMSIPLDAKGMMNITGVKALERI